MLLNYGSIDAPLPEWERPGEGGKDRQYNLLCLSLRVSPSPNPSHKVAGSVFQGELAIVFGFQSSVAVLLRRRGKRSAISVQLSAKD